MVKGKVDDIVQTIVDTGIVIAQIWGFELDQQGTNYAGLYRPDRGLC